MKVNICDCLIVLKVFVKNLRNLIGFLLRNFRSSLAFPKTSFGFGTVVAGYCKFGKNVRGGEFCNLADVKIGDRTYFGNNCLFVNVDLGAYCSIASFVRVGMHEHPVREYVSTHPIFHMKKKHGDVVKEEVVEWKNTRRTKIGNDVWLGEGCKIKRGVNVGDGAIVATGAVVVKDVPEYAIVGGCPAKVIRFRFTEKQIEKLKKICWWEWPEEELTKKIKLFADVNIFLKDAENEH